MKKTRWIFRALAAGLAVVWVAGCGGGPTNVAGKITYKGAPVTSGTVKLYFDGGKDFGGSIQPNGNYAVQVQGASGKAAVAIETESSKSLMPGGATAGKTDPFKGAGGDRPKAEANLTGGMPQYMKIPAKYADPKGSGLTVEVKGGQVTQNFDLLD